MPYPLYLIWTPVLVTTSSWPIWYNCMYDKQTFIYALYLPARDDLVEKFYEKNKQ